MAMVIQVIIRLTLYLDQAIIRGGRTLKGNSSLNGIENTVSLYKFIFLVPANGCFFFGSSHILEIHFIK